ncbi:hypothetical protein [Salinimicrobium oceani]|uniref:N-acetyltransferase domain-containing protein n=1 Tax=Salinimicrobium oceani TaxID=2722702 RepID=A0ABX1CU32_9FLAO|nr:hypothetical protein [Salinimicrobium oceani]NJW51798.1 hypothetical protein [Salinimicrobium oceani]
MAVLKENKKLLEVKEFSVDGILDEISIRDNSENAQWLTKDLVLDLWQTSPLQKKNKEKYLVWLKDKRTVGFALLQEKRNREAVIHFKIKEREVIAPEDLQVLLETSINKAFDLFNLEKILFDCGDYCSSEISQAFIQAFQPHPVGWVHLNDGKYVLTKGQLDQTEEEFYKM